MLGIVESNAVDSGTALNANLGQLQGELLALVAELPDGKFAGGNQMGVLAGILVAKKLQQQRGIDLADVNLQLAVNVLSLDRQVPILVGQREKAPRGGETHA